MITLPLMFEEATGFPQMWFLKVKPAGLIVYEGAEGGETKE